MDGTTLDYSACRNDNDNRPEFEIRECHKDVCRELVIIFYVCLIIKIASWKKWSNWSVCSTTCGVGTHERARTCENDLTGEIGCDGNPKDERNCEQQDCRKYIL